MTNHSATLKCRLSIARCVEAPNETEISHWAGSIANSLTLSRQGALASSLG